MHETSAEATIVAALLMGLLGSTHCVAMCGGIVGALSQSWEDRSVGVPAAIDRVLRQLLYSLGRIVSYAGLGALAGGVGLLAGDVVGARGEFVLRLGFGAAMLLVGLSIAGWWKSGGVVEQLGLGLWRRLTPLLARVSPIDRAWKVVAAGALWGWLPCGLVYAAAAGAASTGSASRGGALMAAFGLGTLPALLATGLAAERLSAFTRRGTTRRLAGALLMAFALWTVIASLGVEFGQSGSHLSAMDMDPAER